MLYKEFIYIMMFRMWFFRNLHNNLLPYLLLRNCFLCLFKIQIKLGCFLNARNLKLHHEYSSIPGCFFMGGFPPKHFCCLGISFLLVKVSTDFVRNLKTKTILLFTVLQLQIYGTEWCVWWNSHGYCLAQREVSWYL